MANRDHRIPYRLSTERYEKLRDYMHRTKARSMNAALDLLVDESDALGHAGEITAPQIASGQGVFGARAGTPGGPGGAK